MLNESVEAVESVVTDTSATPTAPAPPLSARSTRLRLVAVTVLTGVGAGIGGMLLALLLHGLQHLAYGYDTAGLLGPHSFLWGVTQAPPWRRVVVLAICGLAAGCGWWLLYRYGKPLVSIAKAVKADDPRMPIVSTTVHALLQIVTVALGSPLGREVAPREIGATWAGWLAHRTGLTLTERRTLVACGAGAGLAAVYNVPLGGAMFVLEVLLQTYRWRALLPALATSAIAAGVAALGLGNEHQYQLPNLIGVTDVTNVPGGVSLLAWAALFGPLFGLAALGFTKITSRARKDAPRDWRLPVGALLNFLIIGLLSITFPQLLGNGRGPATLSFDNDLTIGLAVVLLALRVLITASTLRAGAEGGLLTPGLANGALMGVILGSLWSLAFPGTPLGAFALIGAAAFLAASMRMPLTAIILILEFTRMNQDFLLPVLVAVAGSVATLALFDKKT